MEELKSSDFTVINLSVTSDIKLEILIDSHRFSSFDRLLRKDLCTTVKAAS